MSHPLPTTSIPCLLRYNIVTARKQNFRQCNVFTPVCHSVYMGEGVCPTPPPRRQTGGGFSRPPGQTPLGRPPPNADPLSMQTPLDADPLDADSPDADPPRCRPPKADPRMQTPQKQTPLDADPPRMQTPQMQIPLDTDPLRIQYASYWNAFLFKLRMHGPIQRACKGGTRDAHPLPIQFLSFPCSFQRKFRQITDCRLLGESLGPPLPFTD